MWLYGTQESSKWNFCWTILIYSRGTSIWWNVVTWEYEELCLWDQFQENDPTLPLASLFFWFWFPRKQRQVVNTDNFWHRLANLILIQYKISGLRLRGMNYLIKRGQIKVDLNCLIFMSQHNLNLTIWHLSLKIF